MKLVLLWEFVLKSRGNWKNAMVDFLEMLTCMYFTKIIPFSLKINSRIKDERAYANSSGIPMIYLFAGDIFAGSDYFDVFREQICIELLNVLGPDVVTIGNQEFNGGIQGLEMYVKGLKAPTVAANLDFEKDIGVKKSVILNVNGEKIGIIGALAVGTKVAIQKSGKTIFKDEISSINSEAQILDKKGVKIIIALTHCGYKLDKKIAKECPLVDLVVGGHSHTFLKSGKVDPIHPEHLNIRGPYPTIIVQKSGKQVPVVQAYCMSKYIGKLKLRVIIFRKCSNRNRFFL